VQDVQHCCDDCCGCDCDSGSACGCAQPAAAVRSRLCRLANRLAADKARSVSQAPCLPYDTPRSSGYSRRTVLAPNGKRRQVQGALVPRRCAVRPEYNCTPCRNTSERCVRAQYHMKGTSDRCVLVQDVHHCLEISSSDMCRLYNTASTAAAAATATAAVPAAGRSRRSLCGAGCVQ